MEQQIDQTKVIYALEINMEPWTKLLFFILFYCAVVISETFSCDQTKCKFQASKTVLNCEKANCTDLPNIENPESLKVLKLGHNNIKHLAQLPDLPNLEILELSYNRISTIAPEAFSKCRLLSSIKLDHNQINSINESIFRFANDEFKELDLSYNHIAELKYESFPVFTTETLNLGHNKLAKIDYRVFQGMSIVVLHLEFNKLNNITSEFLGSFRNHLQKIFLQNNLITELPSNFLQDVSFNLQEINLSSNLIRKIENDTFVGDGSELPENLQIDLSRNEIAILKNNTFSSVNLKELKLDGNQFTEITAGYFGGCTAEKISLKGCNKLRIIKNGSFKNLPQLSDVDISHCGQLSVIEDGAFGMNNRITRADFSNNQLQTLSKNLLNWKKVNAADISFNPWNCNCNIEWMIELPIRWINLKDTRCASPSHLNQMALESVPWNQFKCLQLNSIFTTRMIAMVLSGGALTVAILLTTVVVLLLRKRWSNVKKKDGFRYKALYNAADSDEAAVTIEMTFITDKTRRKYRDDPTPTEV